MKGIMATILGVISLASLVYIIIDSYTRAGEIPLQYGAVAFLTMIFAFVGIVLGVMSKSEKDKFIFQLSGYRIKCTGACGAQRDFVRGGICMR